jgi:hypothetical protein
VRGGWIVVLQNVGVSVDEVAGAVVVSVIGEERRETKA